MQQASLLYYSAKPQSGGILGCALVCPTSLYVRTIRFPTFCRSLPSVGAYSQYPAWSGCRRSADVPRADQDRVGSSPWQGGFKERVYCACLPSICLIFSTCKYAATAFNFKHKKTINVTDLSWPKTFRYRNNNFSRHQQVCVRTTFRHGLPQPSSGFKPEDGWGNPCRNVVLTQTCWCREKLL